MKFRPPYGKTMENTDKEVGRKLTLMGYERKHQTKGASYRMKERLPAKPKQVVLVSKR